MVPIDPNSLPRDAETLRKIVVDLAEQLDRSLTEQNKYQSLLRELLEAQRNRKSEQLSKEQLALFEAAWQARSAEGESAAGEDDDDPSDPGKREFPVQISTVQRRFAPMVIGIDWNPDRHQIGISDRHRWNTHLGPSPVDDRGRRGDRAAAGEREISRGADHLRQRAAVHREGL